MKILKVFSVLSFVFLMSCSEESITYHLNGVVKDSKEFNISLPANSFKFDLKTSKDFEGYINELVDIKDVKISFEIDETKRGVLLNSTLLVDGFEIDLSESSLTPDGFISNKDFLAIITEKLLEKREISIRLLSNVDYSVEFSYVNIEMIIHVDGVFEGGH